MKDSYIVLCLESKFKDLKPLLAENDIKFDEKLGALGITALLSKEKQVYIRVFATEDKVEKLNELDGVLGFWPNRPVILA